MAEEDDDQLALRCRDGDAQALATLYRRHASALLEYLERRTGQRHDAEDILQDTFVRIFDGRGRYEGRGRFRSWLFTVATRLAVDRARQRQRRSELASTHYESIPPGAEVPERRLPDRTRIRIEMVLSTLPAEYSQAFHLRILAGFTYGEIAAICGDPEGTLRSRVHHTLGRIRDELRQDLDAARGPRVRTRDETPC